MWEALHPEPEPIERLPELSKSKLRLIPGLGITSISYQQSNVPSYSGIALNGKLLAEFKLSRKWVAQGEFHTTFAPLQASLSGVNVQYLGATLGMIYEIPKVFTPKWDLRLTGGLYYETTITSSSDFGFTDLTGPLLSPTLIHSMKDGSNQWIYLKYTLVFSGFSLENWANFGIAGGLGYLFPPFKNRQSLGLSFEIAALSLQLQSVSVQSNSFTLGTQYRF
jgi:hypothetical protein